LFASHRFSLIASAALRNSINPASGKEETCSVFLHDTYKAAGKGIGVVRIGCPIWERGKTSPMPLLPVAARGYRRTSRITPHPENNPMATATDDRLRLLIERVERLEEEKKGIADDIRDTYAEAKAVGYDAKIMRQVVRLRKMNQDDRAEMEMLLDTYKAALGLG
jgi:uncharacterized protein (UPF0335 family)